MSSKEVFVHPLITRSIEHSGIRAGKKKHQNVAKLSTSVMHLQLLLEP